MKTYINYVTIQNNTKKGTKKLKQERYNPNIEIGLTEEQVQQRKIENLVNTNQEVPTKSVKQILQENFIKKAN